MHSAHSTQCDEKHPICGPCERLQEYCDYMPRYDFKDDTIKQRSRRTDTSEVQCPAWDNTTLQASSQPSLRPPDTLPPFHTLKEEEHRERKAQSRPPGTYHVIANPQSFASLPEYGGRPSRSNANCTSPSLDHTPTQDPNTILLKRFETQREDHHLLSLEHTASTSSTSASTSPTPHSLQTGQIALSRPGIINPVRSQPALPASPLDGRFAHSQQPPPYTIAQSAYPQPPRRHPQHLASQKYLQSMVPTNQATGHPNEGGLLPYASTASLAYGNIPYRSSASGRLPPHSNAAPHYQQLANQSQPQWHPPVPLIPGPGDPTPQQQDWIHEAFPSRSTRNLRDSYRRQGS